MRERAKALDKIKHHTDSNSKMVESIQEQLEDVDKEGWAIMSGKTDKKGIIWTRRITQELVDVQKDVSTNSLRNRRPSADNEHNKCRPGSSSLSEQRSQNSVFVFSANHTHDSLLISFQKQAILRRLFSPFSITHFKQLVEQIPVSSVPEVDCLKFSLSRLRPVDVEAIRKKHDHDGTTLSTLDQYLKEITTNLQLADERADNVEEVVRLRELIVSVLLVS